MKVKKNDNVLVVTGKDAGKTGKVMFANPDANKVKVEGINVQKKSQKARSANETSKIVEQVGAIDASNVMVVCPSCNKATRVTYSTVGDKKVRVCKKCGAVLDVNDVSVKKAAAAAKKATKKTATKKTTKKKTETATAADGKAE